MITTDNHVCWECGRYLTNARYEIECLDGGLRPRRITDPPADLTALDYMGWYPVGPDCAKRLRARDIFVRTIP